MFRTGFELYVFLCDAAGPHPPSMLNEPSTWMEVVARYVGNDCHYFSRGDDGRIRAVLFGWPIWRLDQDVGYEGGYVERDDRDGLFYVRLLVSGDQSTGELRRAMRAIDDRVCERHPRITEYVFHRPKHGNRTERISKRSLRNG